MIDVHCMVQEASVGGLRAVIASSRSDIPVERQRLAKFGSDGTVTLLVEPSKLLSRDHGVWPGEDILLEVSRVASVTGQTLLPASMTLLALR